MDFNQGTIEKLAQLNDDELTALLAAQIRQKQANGTLGELEKMLRVMTPFLSDEQKARLARIIQAAQKQ